jgi:hypothetical protein
MGENSPNLVNLPESEEYAWKHVCGDLQANPTTIYVQTHVIRLAPICVFSCKHVYMGRYLSCSMTGKTEDQLILIPSLVATGGMLVLFNE